MNEPMRPQYTVLDGPSVLAPWPAVAVEFPAPAGRPPPPDAVANALDRLLMPALAARVPRPLPDAAFETVAGLVASALADVHGPTGLAVRSLRSVEGRCRILLGYHEPAAALLALEGGLAIAQALFRAMAGQRVDFNALADFIQRVINELPRRQPDPLARALLRVAGRRGIPAYPVAPGARVWQFGQGRAGVHFLESATEADALTGSRIARNKFHASQVVNRLGLPAARHRLVASAADAVQAAAELGVPVVVKPVDSSKGRGVTVAPADIEAAYRLAAPESGGRVLVEELIPGDDHRLAVIGGTFAWAVRRSPPRVTGDGTGTVSELVDRENARRAALPDRELSSGTIVLDDEARAVLAAAGLTPESRPAAGAEVLLGRVANVARGGTLTDCSATIHPDNVALAEGLARSLRLDATGIDFVTPDITVSWRDIRSAVIELNTTPGFSSEQRAELILARRFPPGATGRIPAVLLVGAAVADLATVGAALATGSPSGEQLVGLTDASETRLGDVLRFRLPATLGERVRGLMLDPACAVLVVGIDAAGLKERGLPLDRFDLALVAGDAGLSPAAMGLLRDCCTTVTAGLPPGGFVAAVAAAPPLPR